MRTALYLMRLASLSHFEASKILKNPHKLKKSSKAALQLSAGCASLPAIEGCAQIHLVALGAHKKTTNLYDYDQELFAQIM